MAQKLDFKLPFNDLINYVPKNLRNPVINSMIDNLFNRFMTHDESIPLYGYAGRKPSSQDDKTPRIPQSSVERDINGIVPVISFKLGKEQVTFTVQDLLNKADALGVSPGGLQWLYTQGHNYVPPIDLDKFTNFFNYYWVAKAIPATPEMAWNTELLPEYYTIAAPKPSDLTKLNVVAATTSHTVLTGTGFYDQTFILNFISPTEFNVTVTGALGDYTPTQTTFTLYSNNQTISYNVIGPAGVVTLLQFDVVRDPIYDSSGAVVGYGSFDVGDEFTITATFLTKNYSVTFNGSSGVKGKITKVKPLNTYQTIDGVLLQEGDRVLVKNNTSGENGIYVVSAQAWSFASDFNTETASALAEVFVTSGSVNSNTLYRSFATSGGYGWNLVPGVSQSNTNDWQEGNYWVNGDDLASLGLSRADAVQALRPIIEYASDMQLNSYVLNGVPSDSGTAFRQVKTEFNELPLFDLYRFDGTHAGLVSSVFFYEEDLTADLDLALQKRVKISSNDSADFMFNHGMADATGALLFVKRNGELKTIWNAGHDAPTIDAVNDVTYSGLGNGTISGLVAHGFTQQQVWTLTATSSTTFSVSGSKMPIITAPYNVITVGVPYNNGEFSATITAGSVAFVQGDTFIFRVGNIESPRYVYRNDADAIYDLFGGEAMDSEGIGAWQIPRTFYNNPYNDSQSSIPEGTLYSHFRSILSNQLQGKEIDYAFGGSIKLWSEQHTLLAALLMQRDMTPISMIDLAQRQYETALNTVRDIYQQNIVNYLATNGGVFNNAELEKLLAYVLEIRSHDNDVRTVLFDSTSAVLGFPVTLPQLGISELVQPEFAFDAVLGMYLLTHHDGHQSPVFIDNQEFRDSIFGNLVGLAIERSDGSSTPAIGSFTNTAPANPYQGEFWMRPVNNSNEVLTFDVKSDSTEPASPAVGDFWYKRSSTTLYQWDGSIWVAQPSLSPAWKVIDLANVLNSLMLLVETKLFNGINPNARKYDFSAVMSDPAFQDQLERELFTFAALNGYDPLAPDYVASNAFTWNYSQGNTVNFPSLNTASVPARWFNILAAHQATVPGVIATARPNLEPWKLLGFAEYDTWWSSLSPSEQASYTPYANINALDSMIKIGSVRAIKTDNVATMLTGLQNIDGVSLTGGDIVLLQNELNPINNGLWTVSAAAWSRTPASLVQDSYVTVSEGAVNRGTIWALTQSAVAGTDPVLFEQVRLWSDALWVDIQVQRPTLRLSVDTVRDELLPPYVSSSNPQVVNALTQFIPAGASLGYSFGDNGPVETVWIRSIEYGYSLARALFRFDPLAFLGFCWGFCWVEVDSVLYDGFDLNEPGHKRFRLHGEPIQAVVRDDLIITGTETFTLTYDAYDDTRHQNFTVRDENGVVLGYVQNDVPATIGSSTVLVKDNGVPFRIGDKFSVVQGVSTFIPESTYKFLGFGQVFTNALRETSIDTGSSYAVAAYREWDVNMGYRASGLVATDNLKIYTDNNTLSTASYSLIFKKNAIAKNEWLQAVRVGVVQIGSANSNGTSSVPSSDGSDWIFRVEGYNSRFLDIEYYDMNTTDGLVSFNALSKAHTNLAWYQPTIPLSTVKATLPLVITGIQNVVNFLFGYNKLLEDRGWQFNNHTEYSIDAETGRVRNWQLEIEKFIDVCYAGIKLGEGHVVNPFMDKVWFKQDKGLLSQMLDVALFDVTGNAAVFDAVGVKFKSDDLNVLRTNEVSEISAAAPMFSVHAQVDEFEHVFIFNNYAEPSTSSGLLYDPFSGSRVVTYKFNGRMQASNTMRPEFGGHYLVGNEVRQNLQASTDNIGMFYDANHAFENELTSRHSLALLGFSTKSYFNDLDISDKSQFNFWRGLIQSKGTNMSIDAYLNNDRFDDAKVDEYWAYKVAEYGDSRQKTFPEMKLSTGDALQQFTQLQFDAETPLVNFTQISSIDESRWFSIDDMNQDAFFKAQVVGTFTKEVAANDIISLPFVADKLIASEGAFTLVNATTVKATGTGTLTIIGYGQATPKYNPVKLFNYVDNELVKEIPVWHPAAGQHNPFAMGSVNIVSSLDPAKYNYSTLIVNNNSYDPLRPWGINEVGRVWFDTTNLKYLPYYDAQIFTSIDERLSRWGALADHATVDVYEWVQSTVPPLEYNALAQTDAGNADISSAVKATGEAALQQTYVRDRLWSTRPIAWSYSSVPIEAAHEAPGAFERQGLGKLYIKGNRAWLETGTFADLNITAGQRIGAFNFDPLVMKPVSEMNVTANVSRYIDFNIASPGNPGQEFAPITVNEVGLIPCIIDVKDDSYTPTIGNLVFSYPAPRLSPVRRTDADGLPIDVWDIPVQVKITEVGTSISDVVELLVAVGTDALSPDLYGATIDVVAGQTFTVTSAVFGVKIILTATSTGTFDADAFQHVIVQKLGAYVTLRDMITTTVVVPADMSKIPNPGSGDVLVLDNNYDPLDLTNSTSDHEYVGWTSWDVPTQAALDADGKQPNSSWKPFLGDLTDPGSAALATIQDAIAYAKNPLTLNDGTVVQRYETSWTDWTVLSEIKLEDINYSGVVSNITVTHTENIPQTRLAVYVNGIAQLKASYSVSGQTVTVKNVVPGGHVTVIIRKYEPSAEELAFDPTVKEDLTFQQQYKRDYEYVSLPVRDVDGAITSTTYFFWVKNKSTVANGKTLSVQAITQELKSGPSNFLTFQNFIGDGLTSSPYGYDAITISGLNYVVTKDDTFKLRFTRNFTLRDDPIDDSDRNGLKDTHTEWSLMRPGQKTRIPETLWMKLTDSVAGQDAAGNAVPALRRVLYDERNGTKTQFGFTSEQTLAPADFLRSTISYTILNTSLVDTSGSSPVPDYISFLNLDDSESWFSDAAASRQTMTDIWNKAKVEQINEIFFSALNEMLACNYELTDIFKTSRLSAYSIKVVPTTPTAQTYE